MYVRRRVVLLLHTHMRGCVLVVKPCRGRYTAPDLVYDRPLAADRESPLYGTHDLDTNLFAAFEDV